MRPHLTTKYVVHRLSPGETSLIKVKASNIYSTDQLEVVEGEVYKIWCNKGQWWVDLFIPTTPDGYLNPIANMFGQRIKGVKCMCLCGTYNNDDTDGFAIGNKLEFKIIKTALLSLFANDVPGYEWNNLGSIEVNIERIC